MDSYFDESANLLDKLTLCKDGNSYHKARKGMN